MTGEEFVRLDAVAQAELVRKNEIHPVELVQAAIHQIEERDPRIHAVVFRTFDEALNTARGELPHGPFRGVPFLVKDLFTAVKGLPCTGASSYLRGYIPDHDSELVRRYRQAGLMLLGKTNTSEFGSLPTTEPFLFGPTRNPWNPERTPGGSSGGSAASVAAGMVPMAHASDAGGSIRIPASCCGLFGLKPTRARTPLGPDFGDLWAGFHCEHAVTRSVRDSAALLDAVSGPDLGDPYWAPPPNRPFLEEVRAPTGPLRIAFTWTSAAGVPAHPDCVRAVRKTARLCEDLGHNVEEASPAIDFKQLNRGFFTVYLAGHAAMLGHLARILGRPPREDELEPVNWVLYQKGLEVTAAEYVSAVHGLQRIARGVSRFFTDYDLWLTPTLAEPPVVLGAFDSEAENPLKGFFRSGAFMPFTLVCNVTGQPAMSVPLHWNDEGLPVGVQFVGRFGDEAGLFRLASRLEEVRPWAHRRPPEC